MTPSRIASAGILFMLLFAAPFPLRAAEKPWTEEDKIEALITHVEELKDATFVRNGRDYDAKAAATFLRGKWKAEADTIETAPDFIGKAASVSSTSGEPYRIRFKDGREFPCGDYLTETLKTLEKEEPKSPEDADKPEAEAVGLEAAVASIRAYVDSFRGLGMEAAKAKLAGAELREEEWKEGGFGGRQLAATFAGYEVLVFFSGNEAVTASFQVLSE